MDQWMHVELLRQNIKVDKMCKQFTDEEIKMANNHKNMF